MDFESNLGMILLPLVFFIQFCINIYLLRKVKLLEESERYRPKYESPKQGPNTKDVKDNRIGSNLGITDETFKR